MGFVPINKSSDPDSAKNTHATEKETEEFMIPVRDQIINDPLRQISERRPRILRLSPASVKNTPGGYQVQLFLQV